MIARCLLVLVLAGAALAQPAPESLPARPAPVTKSPGTAVLLSALVPGGGQVYTGHWWKTALIAPAELTLAYFSVRDHVSANDALRAGDEDGYRRLRDRRNTLLWWTGAVVAFSMADAYVSAQMYGFDRQMEFTMGPGSAGVRMEF